MSDPDAPGAPVSVLDVIDQIEGLVAEGKRIVFTGNVVVNEEELLELVDHVRLLLPEELKQAHYAVEQQQRVLAEAEEAAEELLGRARAEVEGMIQAAQDQAAALVSDSMIRQAAMEQARGLVGEAEARAARIRADADGYARSLLVDLESRLGRQLTEVRNGIERLVPSRDGEPAVTS